MKIKYSPKSVQQLQKLCNYLETEWSPRIRDRFLDKFEESVFSILQMPFAFPESEKKRGLRKCVVTPQTIIFYRILPGWVQVVSIKDGRQKRAF